MLPWSFRRRCPRGLPQAESKRETKKTQKYFLKFCFCRLASLGAALWVLEANLLASRLKVMSSDTETAWASRCSSRGQVNGHAMNAKSAGRRVLRLLRHFKVLLGVLERSSQTFAKLDPSICRCDDQQLTAQWFERLTWVCLENLALRVCT